MTTRSSGACENGSEELTQHPRDQEQVVHLGTERTTTAGPTAALVLGLAQDPHGVRGTRGIQAARSLANSIAACMSRSSLPK